jgi:hypothetical protein
VRVKIDQTGRHDKALRLDHAARLFIGNRGRNARDYTLLDRDIVNAS